MHKPVGFLNDDALFIRQVTETVPYILYVFDLEENRTLYVNREIREVLGFVFDESKSMAFDIVTGADIHPDDRDRYREYFRSFKDCRDDEAREHIYRQIDAKGRWRWFLSRDRVFRRSESGKPLQIMGCLLDITEKKENEVYLKLNETMLKEAQAIAHIGSFKWDVERDVAVCSEELYRIFEEEPFTINLNLSIFKRTIFQNDRERMIQALQVSIDNRMPFDCEYRAIIKSKIKHLLARGKVVEEDGVLFVVGTLQDVTTQRETAKLLEESQHFIKQVADTSPNIIFVYDVIRKKNLYSNQQLLNFIGLPKNEFLQQGNMSSLLVHPDDLHIMVKRQQQFEAAEDGEIIEEEFRVINAQGEWRWLSSKTVVFKRDQEGRVWQILGNAQDITRQKETEMAIIKSQYFNEQISNVTPGLITVYNIKTGQYIYVNRAITSLLGYSKSDLLDKGIEFLLTRVHPDDLPRLAAENQAALEKANADPSAANDVINFEYRVKDKKGKWIWLHTTGTVFDRAEDGSVEHVLNVSIDITERKLAEEKLISNEALLSEAQELVKLGTWEWNIENDQLTWSNQLYRIFGYKPRKQSNLGFDLFLKHIHPEDLNYVKSVIAASLGSHRSFSIEHRIVTVQGDERILLGKGKVITREGKAIKMFGTTMDITNRKQAEMDMQRVQIEFETQKRLNEKKDEFIGIASHELKTPLTSIKAYVQLLEMEIGRLDSEPCKKYIHKANIHIQRLNELIADLLDASKIQSGKLQFNISTFDIQDLIIESIENMQLSSLRHQILYTPVGSKDIRGDKQRIEQVLINVLSNAIKYSPQADKVWVELSVRAKDVVISIIDHGIGIPRENIPKIFERFYRVEGLSTQFSGLGIGLYISNEIVKRHRGRFEVDSIPGKGSTFRIILPFLSK